MVGKELGDELAKRRVEGRAAAGGISEQRSAARLEMLAQGLEVLVVEVNGRPAVDVNKWVVDQVGIASEQVLLGDHDIKAERRPAERLHQVGDGLGGDVPFPGVLELGDSQGPAPGGIRLEVVRPLDRELVGRHLAARRIVDHVLTHPERLDDRRVGRAPFDLVPVAREILAASR